MKGTRVSYLDRNNLAIIWNFEKMLEDDLKTREPTKEKITLENVTTMPTYAFANLALQSNTPEELVKIMEVMRKRYFYKRNVEKNVIGFFDCMEAKAYAYIALVSRDLSRKKKFDALAIKFFKKAINMGYTQAEFDLADFKLKSGDKESAISIIEKQEDLNKSFSYLGEYFYSFDELVVSATRAIEGKRPLIDDKRRFDLARSYYLSGKDSSRKCLICSALFEIIDGNKEEAIKIIKKELPRFKRESANLKSLLFKSDLIKLKNSIELLEKSLNKQNKR